MFDHPLTLKLIEYHQLKPDQIAQLGTPPELSLSHHPSFFSAVEMIQKAIEMNQSFMIYGDYDADGICSTSILFLTLKRLKANAQYYLPNRFTDGYGISGDFVDRAIEQGIDFFILVDNGVSAHDALERISKAQKQVIILDHHHYEGTVTCDVLIHAQMLEHPHESLCASGLAQQLSHHLSGFEAYYATLAGLATVADMMPVWGYNRAVIQHAIQQLNSGHYPHVRALFTDAVINEESIAYQVVPKLNAVGRLVDPMDINLLVKYLSFNDQTLKEKVLALIEDINRQRKELQKTMQKRALDLVELHPIVCVADESFHEGIVGITAGHLARIYQRPAIVLHRDQQRLKGSARSFGNINLLDTLQPLSPYLARLGGHAAAVGLELSLNHFDAFYEGLKTLKLELNASSENQGIPLRLEWLTLEAFEGLNQLRPFGQGFEYPRFELRDVVVKHVYPMKTGYRVHVIYQQQPLTLLVFDESLTPERIQASQRYWVKITLDTYQQQTRLKLLLEAIA